MKYEEALSIDDRSLSGAEDAGLSEAKGYSIKGTILPRFWLPTYSADHLGEVVGALTVGQDVIGYNTYFIEADYGMGSDENYYNAIYLNNYFYPSIELQAYARPVLYSKIYSDAFDDYHFYEKEVGASLSMTLPLNRLESRAYYTIGF